MENPELVLGIPGLVIGALGLLVALLLVGGGDEQAAPSAGRAGWQAFIALAWFTVIEYAIAIETSYNIVLLMAIAVAKVAVIAWIFMRVMRVRGHEEH